MVAAGLVLLALSAGIGLVAFVKFSHIGPDVVWRAYPRLSFAALFAAPGLGAILGVAALLQITEHRATLKGIPIAIAAIVVGSVLAVIGFGLSLDFTM